MNLSALRSYEESERAAVHEFGPKAVVNGIITDASLIYSDHRLASRIAFQRSGSPLNALIWLYETTVVYVPPTTKGQLEKRFAMPWSTFMELAEAGSVQPIVGHPEHYHRRGYADELFGLRPPSVWARGDELAHAFSDASEYWALALAEMPAEEMVSIDWVVAKFRRHFPNLRTRALAERIAIELRTNFVDLCIFGYEPLARDLAALQDRSWSARRILELSELITYPSLMGMGGVPSYGFRSSAAISVASGSPLWMSAPMSKEFGPEAALLVEGLKLSIPGEVDTDALAQFHAEGMSKRLWKALGKLEAEVARSAQDPDDAVEASIVAQRTISETLRRLNSVPSRSRASRHRKGARQASDLALKVGTVGGIALAGHGLLGLDWLAALLAGAALAPPFWTLRPLSAAVQSTEDRVWDMLQGRSRDDLAVQLWWLSRWRDQLQSADVHADMT